MSRPLPTVLVALVLAATVFASPATVAATIPTATWEMNEPAGAAVMADTSGNGLHGSIGSEVIAGATYQGATGYRFTRLPPNTPPARPEHIVTVPDNPSLDPGGREYTVEVRYRTTNPFGNLAQKGQSGSVGGYWKIQLPQGEPSCLFRGPTGVTNAVRATTRIDDGQWHVVRCEHAPGSVTLYVDGVRVGRNTGSTGPIDNTRPLSVGGKTVCDQIAVTCDYFGGDVDWLRIRTGP